MTDSKVQQALEAYEEGKSTEEVAEQLGYSDRTGVSSLMRRNGYRYDRAAGQYVPDGEEGGGGNGANSELPEEVRELLEDRDTAAALKLLQEPDTKAVLQRTGELLQLLDDKSLGSLADTLSSPLLQNNDETRQKAFRFPKALIDQVEEFAARTNLKQRQIFESALVEFLKRRGGDLQ